MCKKGSNMDKMHTEKTGSMFLFGLILGALTAALLTPKRGEDLRTEVKDNAQKIRNKLSMTTKDVEGKVGEKAEKLSDKLNQNNNDSMPGSRR
jgi:gas vesicle protein